MRRVIEELKQLSKNSSVTPLIFDEEIMIRIYSRELEAEKQSNIKDIGTSNNLIYQSDYTINL